MLQTKKGIPVCLPTRTRAIRAEVAANRRKHSHRCNTRLAQPSPQHCELCGAAPRRTQDLLPALRVGLIGIDPLEVPSGDTIPHGSSTVPRSEPPSFIAPRLRRGGAGCSEAAREVSGEGGWLQGTGCSGTAAAIASRGALGGSSP